MISCGQAKGAIGKGQKALEGKKEEIAAVEAEYAAATADVDAKMAKLATTEHAFQNMCAGVDEVGLPSLLACLLACVRLMQCLYTYAFNLFRTMRRTTPATRV